MDKLNMKEILIWYKILQLEFSKILKAKLTFKRILTTFVIEYEKHISRLKLHTEIKDA